MFVSFSFRIHIFDVYLHSVWNFIAFSFPTNLICSSHHPLPWPLPVCLPSNHQGPHFITSSSYYLYLVRTTPRSDLVSGQLGIRLVPKQQLVYFSLLNISRKAENSLLHNPLNRIHTPDQILHPRSIAQPHEMMTRRIEKIPALRGVQIEEDARYNNDLLL
jgi:hypothetical protein